MKRLFLICLLMPHFAVAGEQPKEPSNEEIATIMAFIKANQNDSKLNRLEEKIARLEMRVKKLENPDKK